MDSLSCDVQKEQGLTVNQTRCSSSQDNSVCHHCCSHNNCNLAESPASEGKHKSCMSTFPVCRHSWYYERNGFVRHQLFYCHCDPICLELGDCCSDYLDICRGSVPPSLSGPTDSLSSDSSLGVGFPPIRCFSCENSPSNEHCNSYGRIVECQPNQRSCFTEIRARGGQRRIWKGCKQTHACKVLQEQANTCTGGPRPCFSCCQVNYCNVFSQTRKTNFSSSCLVKFPGYPLCKRSEYSVLPRSMPEPAICSCDSQCRHFHKCCDDYALLCETSETENMSWIFSEAGPPPIWTDQLALGHGLREERGQRQRNSFSENRSQGSSRFS
uniref:SMB domain-containing protein n=1 Tax=Ciona savignyi TaxID=51511 RepID=H2YSM5_CIOSA